VIWLQAGCVRKTLKFNPAYSDLPTIVRTAWA
jgi:hypothetical protein